MRLFRREPPPPEPPEWLPAFVDTYLEGFKRLPDPSPTPELPPDALTKIMEAISLHTTAIAVLQADVKEVRNAVAIAIEHEERREKRIQATVRRGRKLLADEGLQDPALEAEFEALKILEDEEFPKVEWDEEADVVDVDDDAPSGIPGMTKADVKRLRESRRG